MGAENVDAKGRRYVSEGRLTVEHLDSQEIRATVRGEGAMYKLGYQRGSWKCSCPALTRCSHLVALMLVTVREG